ncbi:MAG: hypothetical protein AAB467_01985 [Patescibacteria group bacterium]
MNRLFPLFIFVVLPLGCNPGGDRCVRYNFYNQFSYRVTPTQWTTDGIAIDPTGQEAPPERIDELTHEVETCLADAFGNPPHLPDDVRRDADCLVETFTLPYDRVCLTVKIPDDWTLSCSGDQVLPRVAPAELCRAKGLEPSPECPCRWRGGIQDNSVIVVTPNLFLYKDPLVRMITSCNNPWMHPSLAACLN